LVVAAAFVAVALPKRPLIAKWMRPFSWLQAG
jgi:hypothetical protein